MIALSGITQVQSTFNVFYLKIIGIQIKYEAGNRNGYRGRFLGLEITALTKKRFENTGFWVNTGMEIPFLYI